MPSIDDLAEMEGVEPITMKEIGHDGNPKKIQLSEEVESSVAEDSDVLKGANGAVDGDSDVPLVQRKKESCSTAVKEEDSDSDVPLVERMKNSSLSVKKEDSDSDVPLLKRTEKSLLAVKEKDSDSDVPLVQRNKKRSAAVKKEDSDSDVPLVQRQRKSSPATKEEDSDSDVPLVQRQKKRSAAIKKEDSDSDVPLVQRKKKSSPATKEEDSDSDVPLVQRQKKSSPATKEEDSDSDDGIPLAKRRTKKDSDSEEYSPVKKPLKTGTSPVRRKLAAKKRHASLSDSDEDTPLIKVAVKKRRTKKDDDSDDGDEITDKKKRKGKAEKKRGKRQKAKEKKEEDPSSQKEEEDDDTYRWWEDDNRDDSIKWATLEHDGVIFTPDYVPHGVQILYDGKPVKLSPPSEEAAGFFAQMLGTQYVENPVFCQNFFSDFLEVLAIHDQQCPIKEFEKCDFRPMYEYFETQKEIRKSMTKEEKNELKEGKKAMDEKYGYAVIDGRREKIGNYRMEPPGLFRGRGDHPKTGRIKKRVLPEQVTLNIGQDAKVPEPPTGHEWGNIVHDNTVSWLATWTENVNNQNKYVMFAANSSLKGMSDFKKFEKARELKKHVDSIRRTYMAELRDKVMMVRQRATAMWLIDRLALRAGNEKGEDEADTVGCCSLRLEHITLEEDEETITDPRDPSQETTIKKKMVVFDFLGKDSIRYYNRVEVDPIVWKNLALFRKPPKTPEDPLFDRLNTSTLNKHLSSLMPGLTAKVFRTFNASFTFQNELKRTPADASVADKILAYNRANRQVAILCNHQRSVPKTHSQQMEKLTENILMMQYERYLLVEEMFEQDPRLKKKQELKEYYNELDAETLERKAKDYEERENERLEKKFEKMCEKAEAEGKSRPSKPKVEKKTLPLNRLETKLETLNKRIYHAQTMKIDRDENKTTALSTSKINYIDPRITAAWCSKYDVPMEKMFTKTLREKFKWAMEADGDWIF